MTKYNKICLAVGLLFVLAFAGADLKTAKADYVDYVNGQAVQVHYTETVNGQMKADIIDVNTGQTIATGVDLNLDEKNNRGVPDKNQIEQQAGQYYDIQPPEREEQAGVMDSTERADDYSCRQVDSCGNNVIGYGSNKPNDPNYALYSATDAREIVTVYYRNSGQYQGNDAWIAAEGIAASLNSSPTLTSQQVNDILGLLGANFQVAPNIEEVSRYDLIKALEQAGQNGSEPGGSPDEEEEEWTPPETGPFVSILECSFTATPAEILYSKSSRLRWNCNRADTCSISDETGVVVRSSITTMSGEVQVSPLKTTRYYLNCSDNKSWETLVRVFSSGIQ
jgi:hypothetical protein